MSDDLSALVELIKEMTFAELVWFALFIDSLGCEQSEECSE